MGNSSSLLSEQTLAGLYKHICNPCYGSLKSTVVFSFFLLFLFMVLYGCIS